MFEQREVVIFFIDFGQKYLLEDENVVEMMVFNFGMIFNLWISCYQLFGDFILVIYFQYLENEKLLEV